MKTMFSLLPTALACLSLGLLGSTAATLCPFDLDADTLQTSVLDSSSPALVAFTQDLDAPTTELMEGAVASLGGLGFCVATFDCADPKHAKTCSITGGNFPFLALYLGEPKMNPYTKKNYREHVAHLPKDSSKESNRQIEKFVAKALGASRIAVGDSEDKVAPLLAPEAVASTPQVLLLATKTQTSLLWRSVAYQFRERLKIAQIKANADWVEDSAIIRDVLGEVTVPSVLLRTQEGIERFHGDMKSFTEIVAWLTKHVGEAPEPATASGNDDEASSSAKSTKSLKSISVTDFSDLLTDATREDVHMVLVRREDTSDLDLTTLQKKCYGAIFCVEFECPADVTALDESVSRFCPAQGSSGGIPSDPYLLVVPYEAADRTKLLASPSKFIFKSSAGEFSVEVQSAAAKKAQDTFPESLAVPIVDSQMQNFLGACIREQVFGMLVLASPGKTSPPAMLRHVAAAHKDMTKIAYVSDPSPQFLQQFGMTDPKFPSALALVQPPEGDQFQVMYYDHTTFGAMNFRSLTSFVYNVIEGAPGMKDMYMKKMQAKQEGSSPAEDSAPSAGPVVLTHITSQQQWEEQCGSTFKGLCVVGFVGAPDLATGEYDSDSVSIFENMMNSLSHHMRASFHFVWLDIVCQAELATSFDLTPDTSPALVMYSPLKKRYATYVGNFKQESLSVFASSMLNSKIKTFPIRGDGVVYDDSSNCAPEQLAEAVEGDEMDDFLAEIRREEEERAETLRLELEAEKKAALEKKAEEEAAAKKKKKKSKKKKKKAKKEL